MRPKSHAINHIRFNGFTLIEVLVSIVVISILTGIALPSFNKFIASTRLNTASTEISNLLFAARADAANQRKTFTLGLDTATTPNIFRSITIDNSGKSFEARNVALPPNVTATATSAIVFQPDGTATAGSFCLANPQYASARYVVSVTAAGYTAVTKDSTKLTCP